MGLLDTLAAHWPVYAIEGALLGAFMLSACLVVYTVEHPESPVPRRIRSSLARRAIIGIAMGLTAIGLIYSPWGARSGAHFNPAVTLAFAALGRIGAVDAAGYVVAQCIGGVAGVVLARAILGRRIAHRTVGYVATRPGPRGRLAAAAAEWTISFALFATVLLMGRTGAAPYTGLVAGLLVAVFITVEAPLSGMSMNPARTLASAIPARDFRGVWVYMIVPPAAMLGAAWLLGGGGAAPTMNPAAAASCVVRCGEHRHGANGIQARTP